GGWCRRVRALPSAVPAAAGTRGGLHEDVQEIRRRSGTRSADPRPPLCGRDHWAFDCWTVTFVKPRALSMFSSIVLVLASARSFRPLCAAAVWIFSAART